MQNSSNIFSLSMPFDKSNWEANIKLENNIIPIIDTNYCETA